MSARDGSGPRPALAGRRHGGSGGAGWPLGAATAGTLLFLHVPLLFIVLYAFSAEDKSFVFPPPGFTVRWFGVAWGAP